ncbi:MAG: hypothetical protein U5K43_12360 [Halofilum sp. (in: g-proteobacteria)]|nr:hypothetical protein [Halofilum sp. (in: g-proteobacteria)]
MAPPTTRSTRCWPASTESYLYRSLEQYKSGARQNAVMQGMVSNLSDQDMRDLAAYYASQDSGVHTLPLNATDE